MAVMMVSFTSCESEGGGGGGSNSGNNTSTSLVGTTWRYEIGDYYCTLNFYSSSNVTVTTGQPSENDQSSYTCTYSYSNGQGIIYVPWTDPISFQVNGRCLYFDDGMGPFYLQ